MMGMFRNYTILSNNDTRIIQALSPLSLISSFLVILFYYKFPATREQPGDVILAVAVSQIFLIIGFISTVVYNSHYPLPQDGSFSIPQGFNTFCSITGYLIVLPFCA